MQTVKEWLARPDIKEMIKNPVGKNMEQPFFRDPMRHVVLNPALLYSPADGIVLYARTSVEPDKFLEIKGKEFTLKDILNVPDYNEYSLVVGIFMTSYDVHINRIPGNAYYLEDRQTNYIFTHNISMVLAENDLLTGLGYDKKHLSYMFNNERRISVFYCPAIKGRYYIVQIGDRDIDVIQNWGVGHHMFQGERMGMIRWGSQVDLIVPLQKGITYKLLVKKLDHVEAGIDPLVKIEKEN